MAIRELTQRTNRRIYSAEELRSLRGSCSAPKLFEAIDEHALEDAELVKDHVLRGSRSFAARSLRSRNGVGSLRAPSDRTNTENASVGSSERLSQQPSLAGRTALSEIANNNQAIRAVPARLRTSPTPSLKRKKAEAIVKAHGSPTHVRVTAGGRIVPSEQSPLCFPRFGYSAIKTNGGLIKFAPNHQVGKTTQWTQTIHDGSQNGFVAQDVEGRLCQIVDGTILPLNEVNGALQLYIPAPNLNITHRGFSHSQAPDHIDSAASGSQPPITAQILALETEYTKFDYELKDLDKTEVIHGRTMDKATKDALVMKRRQLVITMDGIRKTIKGLKERATQEKACDRPQTPTHAARSNLSFVSPRMAHAGIVDSKQGDLSQGLLQHTDFFAPPFVSIDAAGEPVSLPSGVVPGPFMMAPIGYMMHPPPFDGPGNWIPPYQAFSAVAAQDIQSAAVPQTDGTTAIQEIRAVSPRQSHALPVKDPDTKQVAIFKSLLNPMSPVYKPAVDGHDGSEKSLQRPKTVKDRPSTPLSFTHLASAKTGSIEPSINAATISSGSSIRTLDFFPQNTRDHSTRKHEYPSPQGSPKPRPINQYEDERDTGGDHVSGPKTATAVKTQQAADPKAPPGTPTAAGNGEAQIIDFSNKPRAWIEGYQAGLNRRPVGADSVGDFLDGYCSGLLKSQPSKQPKTLTCSPEKRLNHQAPRTAFSESDAVPFHLQRGSDCTDIGICAPRSDCAILSPDPVAEKEFNAAAWEKTNQFYVPSGQGLSGFPFPDRKSSILHDRQIVRVAKRDSHVGDFIDEGNDLTIKIPDSSLEYTVASDTDFQQSPYMRSPSAASQAQRVITPLEWRTRNSLANVANISANLFTHTQVDGQQSGHDDHEPMLANASEMAGSPYNFNPGSRFKESSLDGLSPPMSPALGSPPVSPRTNPIRRFRERHSPVKVSPVKQFPEKTSANRFSLLASPDIHERVGHKQSPSKHDAQHRSSSPSKYRWKELWKGSRAASGKPSSP